MVSWLVEMFMVRASSLKVVIVGGDAWVYGVWGMLSRIGQSCASYLGCG